MGDGKLKIGNVGLYQTCILGEFDCPNGSDEGPRGQAYLCQYGKAAKGCPPLERQEREVRAAEGVSYTPLQTAGYSILGKLLKLPPSPISYTSSNTNFKELFSPP